MSDDQPLDAASRTQWELFLTAAECDQKRWRTQVELLTLQAQIISEQLEAAQYQVAGAEYRIRSARQWLT